SSLGNKSETLSQKKKKKKKRYQDLSKVTKPSVQRRRQSAVTTQNLRRRYQSLHFPLNCHLSIRFTGTFCGPGTTN
uniref:Uncharacterized protein n=1 Tax=Piliocolobus tephrosceles TaxID=591936 RepID=A0A8C9I1J6_9PRIM